MAENQNYVVGRGRLYFDRFAEGELTGTGLRYFGNTSALGITRSNTALDHYSSESGLKVKDSSVTIQDDITASFTTDNISSQNLALWFGATVEDTVNALDSADVTQALTVHGDAYYQIGVGANTPGGARNLTVAHVAVGGTPAVADGTAYTVDLEAGLIYIVPGGPLDVDGGSAVSVTYRRAAATREHIITRGATVYGALTFISDNPVGKQKDYLMPYVKLTSNGDYSLKGDSWQEMQFTAEVLKRPDGLAERVYITAR